MTGFTPELVERLRIRGTCRQRQGITDTLSLDAADCIAELTEALEDCRDYFEERADAELDETGYTGNEEMRLLVAVNRVLGKVGGQTSLQKALAKIGVNHG